MPKKENPLRQLPASSDEYGTFKIHLDGTARRFHEPAFLPDGDAAHAASQLPG